MHYLNTGLFSCIKLGYRKEGNSFTVNILSHLSGCQVSLSSTKSFLSVPWEVQNILLKMKMFFFPLLLNFFEAHIQAFIQRMKNPENPPGSIILMNTEYNARQKTEILFFSFFFSFFSK